MMPRVRFVQVSVAYHELGFIVLAAVDESGRAWTKVGGDPWRLVEAPEEPLDAPR
jgi:hypothetical protein